LTRKVSEAPVDPSVEGKDSAETQVLQELTALAVDNLTPLDALRWIHDWKRFLAEQSPDHTAKSTQRNAAPEDVRKGPSLFDA
jgi:hypothetical protein